MGLSNAERQRRYIARLKARGAPPGGGAPEPRIRELEAENADLRGRLTEEIKARLRREAKAGKSASPVTGRDGEDPRIARLQNRNKELRGELHELKKWYASGIAKKGGMNWDTFNKVVRCLHPEFRKHVSAADIDEACGLFTQWKKDRDKA